MPVSFNPDLVTAVDRLRFAVGDTDTAAALLQDETYEAVLAQHGGDEQCATLDIAEALIARYAQEPNRVQLGASGLTIDWNNRLAGWQRLAYSIRATFEAQTQQQQATLRQARTLRPSRDEDRGVEYRSDGGRVPW